MRCGAAALLAAAAAAQTCPGVEQDTTYLGDDIKKVAASSADECCALCNKEAGCKYWNFHNKKRCNMKSARGNTKTNKGDVSGSSGSAPAPTVAPGPTPAPAPEPTPAPVPGPTPEPVPTTPNPAPRPPVPPSPSGSQPHIVLTVMDDLGYHDLGFRNSGIKTPHFDSFANEGLVLENYYVMMSCAPTRSTMMTGRFATRTGIYTPFFNGAPEGIPIENTLMPAVLKGAGYATHMIGKWHLGFCQEKYTPTFRGFDTYYGYYGSAEDYFTHEHQKAYDFHDEKQPNCGKGCSVSDRGANGTYSTFLFSQRAATIIHAHDAATPLFLYLAWQAVHMPRQVPYTWAAPYEHGPRVPDFSGMTAAADDGFGNVTDALRARGMLDNTVVVFSTDNGGPIEGAGEDIGASNYPLRGGKHTLWEGGTRGASFVWAKGLGLRAGTHGGLMHSVDWLPTFAQLAGASTAKCLTLDGKSQWASLFGGSASPHPHLFTCVHNNPKQGGEGWALRKGDWKLIAGSPGQYQMLSSPDGCNAKIIKDTQCTGKKSTDDKIYTGQTHMLFNVTADPGEHHDLAGANADVVGQLQALLKPYQDSAVGSDYAQVKACGKEVSPKGGEWVPTA